MRPVKDLIRLCESLLGAHVRFLAVIRFYSFCLIRTLDSINCAVLVPKCIKSFSHTSTDILSVIFFFKAETKLEMVKCHNVAYLAEERYGLKCRIHHTHWEFYHTYSKL